jgi:hypothetical protein
MLAWQGNTGLARLRGSPPSGFLRTGGAERRHPKAWERATVKRFWPLCDLLIMTRLTGGRLAVVSAGAAAVHVLAWPYTAVVLAATAVYRLLAERARRKTLVDLVSRAPTGTIVVMGKGPGSPAMWVRVGDGPQFPPPRGEVWRGR